MTTGKCNDCGKPRMNGSVRCAEHHAKWLRDMMNMVGDSLQGGAIAGGFKGKQEDYCGLDPLLTGEYDPFYQSGACPNHDHDFDKWKAGEPVKGGLVGVSYRWTRDVLRTAAISAWGILGAPFYLIGGLVGGAIRWRMVAPKIKPDDSTEDEHI